MQTTQKTTTLKIKQLGERWPRKRASKRFTQEPYKTLNITNNIVQKPREKWPKGEEPYKTLNITNNIVQKPREKWPKGEKKKKKKTLTRRSARKVVKTKQHTHNKNRVTKGRQPSERKTSAKSLKEVLITKSSHTKY